MRAGKPKATTASGRTAVAAMAMPENQIETTTSNPASGSLRVDGMLSIVIGMLEPVSGVLDTFDIADQRTHRRIDAETARAGRRLDRQPEYRLAVENRHCRVRL